MLSNKEICTKTCHSEDTMLYTPMKALPNRAYRKPLKNRHLVVKISNSENEVKKQEERTNHTLSSPLRSLSKGPTLKTCHNSNNSNHVINGSRVRPSSQFTSSEKSNRQTLPGFSLSIPKKEKPNTQNPNPRYRPPIPQRARDDAGYPSWTPPRREQPAR